MDKQDLYLDLISKMEELDFIFTSLQNNYYNKISISIDRSIARISILKDELWSLKNSNKLYLNCDNTLMQSIIEDFKFINNKLEITDENILKTDINTAKSVLKNIIDKIKKTKNTRKADNNVQKLPQEATIITKPIINFGEYFRLVSIKLEKFKNFSKFQHNFISHNNLSILIGNNGSGKSNLLEAISAIFAELYLSIPTNFGYKLEYDIKGCRIILQKELGKRKQYICNNKKTTKQILEVNGLIPSKVIAMYSGEETRLWNKYYRKAYEKWKKDINKVNRLRYISKEYWDIALFSLLMSKSEEHQTFIKEELSINNIDYIEFEFDIARLKNSIDRNLDQFVGTINPKKKYKMTSTLDELKKALLYLDAYSIFTLLTNASMHNSNKMIKSVKVIFNNGLCVYDLSEGEKKKLLLKVTMDFVADENSIILLDEPDAHIHEVGKVDICTMFEKYSEEFNRQIIVTTHSPTLAHCANDNHLIMLENNNGISSVIENEKVDKIKKLTGGIWSATQQNIFLNSKTPLVLFEGIGDISYVKKAIELFKNEFPKLNTIDFLPFGGAANACEFIQKIRDITNKEKKIIMVFDRDDAGQDGLGKCLPPNVFKEGVKNTKTYLDTRNNVIYLMLPMTEERKSILPENANGKDLHFLIEDCFSSLLRKQIAQECIDETSGFFNKYTKDLKDHIKQMLTREEYHTPDNMLGFKPLLMKIQNIIDGDESLEEV